ncbi:hypothetical protein BDV93DRAFT_602271 [Ceratobasidium sp. AG-I]|nr:hypothetical protein BDV93DRAFT_602271 [Ceratobasidium sp. AG-I]
MAGGILSPKLSSSLSTLRLLDLPPEVLVIVVYRLLPIELARLSQSCRALYLFVNNLGDLVWKEMFLAVWDDAQQADEAVMAIRTPDFCSSPDDFERELSTLSDCDKSKRAGTQPSEGFTYRWQDEVQRRTEAQIFLAQFGQSSDASVDKMSYRRFNSLATLLSTLATTPPASATLTRSRNMAWVDNILAPGKFDPELFLKHFSHHPDVKQPLTPDRQLTAKLQVHFFSTRHHVPYPRLSEARLNARAYVYNIHNYRTEGWHGPWVMEEGLMQPNWIHLAACQRVILANLMQRRSIGQAYPLPPTGAEATWGQGAKAVMMGYKANPSRINENGIYDWAGVEGIWKRLVCFMDYRDFHEYNFHGARTSGGIDTSVFRQPMFGEATRSITMSLRLTHSEPSETPFEHRPRLHFNGFSVGSDTMISAVHGFVCMTPSGYIRWNLVTRYQSEDRWVTEAVQIGDVGSAAGFLGTWTGNSHDIDDPAGPTWLWKVADVSEMPQGEGTQLMNALFAFPEFMDDAEFVGGDDDEDEDEDEDEEGGDEDEGEDEDEDMENEYSDEDEDGSDGTSSDDDSESDGSSSSLPPLIPIYHQPVTSLSDLD